MRLLSAFLLLSILACCSVPSETETPPQKKENPNWIVLIFKNPVENGFYKNPETSKRGFGRTAKGDEIQIVNDHYVMQRLSFEIGAEADTVVIDTHRDLMEVKLMYKGIDDLTYLFQNGDSVEFTYEGIKPIAHILNREEDALITNYSLFVRDSIAIEGFTAYERFRNPLLKLSELEDSGMPMEAFFEKVQKEAAEDLTFEYKAQYRVLDSMRATGVLSKVHYDFRLQNLLRSIQTSELTTRTYGKQEHNDLLQDLIEVIDEFKNRYPNTIHSRNDSLLYTSSYLAYLSTSVTAQYHGKIKMISREGRGAGARTLNHLQRYDSIRITDFMSPLEKKVIQYQTMDAMLSQPGFFSIRDRLKYLNRFRNDFQDSAMVQSLVSKYNIEFKIEDDILLESISGEKISMQELVAEHEGKLVYVDFWASWCGPCIKEMPYSKTLQTELADQPIVYLYISSDRTAAPWKKAMDKHELKQGLHYRITNASTSQGLEDLQIMFIPRYMIYDMEGKLVNRDTFRPSELAALKAEFAKYL